MATMTQTYKVIDRETLRKKLENEKGKFRLWNVITRDYFKPEKNIPGSKWIPVTDLSKELPGLDVKKDEAIVVYCGSFQCPSSKQAAQLLSKEGYTNVSAYEGGLADWKEGGLPLVKIGE